MADFNPQEAARRFAMMEAMNGEHLVDGQGPGDIAGYLDRRAQTAWGQAAMDAAIGAGAIGAGYALAPVTGGASFIPGYGIGGMNIGRALSGAGDAYLKGLSAQRFEAMPQGNLAEEEAIARQFRMQGR